MKKITQTILVAAFALSSQLAFSQTVKDTAYNDRKPAGANNGRAVDPANGTNLDPYNGNTNRPANSIGANDTSSARPNTATGNTREKGIADKNKKVVKGKKK